MPYLPSITTGFACLLNIILGSFFHWPTWMFDKLLPRSRYSIDFNDPSFVFVPPTTMIPNLPDMFINAHPCFLLLVDSGGPWDHLPLFGSNIWTLLWKYFMTLLTLVSSSLSRSWGSGLWIKNLNRMKTCIRRWDTQQSKSVNSRNTGKIKISILRIMAMLIMWAEELKFQSLTGIQMLATIKINKN